MARSAEIAQHTVMKSDLSEVGLLDQVEAASLRASDLRRRHVNGLPLSWRCVGSSWVAGDEDVGLRSLGWFCVSPCATWLDEGEEEEDQRVMKFMGHAGLFKGIV